MQAQLIFNLPEDQNEHLAAVHAVELLDTLRQIRSQCRLVKKHDANSVHAVENIMELIAQTQNATGLEV